MVSLSRQLGNEYSSSFSDKNIRRMMQFAFAFTVEQIVVSAIRQLSLKHFILIRPTFKKLKGNLDTEKK